LASAPSWNDPARWARLVSGADCPLCGRRDRPGIVAELQSCYAVVDETVNVRGYCCLILKRHAIELHQLSESEGASFMKDVQHVAAALQSVTSAIKINYEIHGNVIPHVHLHLVPRYPGDTIERSGKGFATITETPYGPGEFERYVEALGIAIAHSPAAARRRGP
jgi:diadenosine tetraphosphate (Ap4A) HIT family hydrolase